LVVTKETSNLYKPKSRVCKQCGADYKGVGNSKYCSSSCSHMNHYQANMLKPDWRLARLLSMAKNRAMSKFLEFDLTLEFLMYLWEESKGCCSLTGQEFDLGHYGEKGQVNPKAPSIDRINPKLGYIKSNVRLITYHMNISLSDFGVEEFENLIKHYRLVSY